MPDVPSYAEPVIDAELWESHAAAFGTLGRLHREPPDQEVLAALHDLLPQWPLRGTLEAETGLTHWQRSWQLGEDAELIRLDHDRLYGVSAAAAVAPYESVHRGDDGLVFDVATLRVRSAYLGLGLESPHLNREPDDHLGLEFDFVSQALLRAVGAADQGEEGTARAALDAARDFVRDHLLTWAPEMLAAAAEAARTEFMTGLMLLSRATLDSCRTGFGLPA